MIDRAVAGIVRFLVHLKDIVFSWIEALHQRPRKAFVWLLVVSTGFVVINTLYALLTKNLHGDIVAQQLIVAQWLSGVTPNEAILGPTNYLLKFPLYAVIEGLFGWVSPFLRLVGTAVLLNAAGWVLIVLSLYKIAKKLAASKNQQLLLGWILLFIALIAGSVFWLNYPNSRNIEIGLMLIGFYWLITLYMSAKISAVKAVLCSAFLGIVFANDQYALFVVGASAGLFFGWKTLRALYVSDTATATRAFYLSAIVAAGGVAYWVFTKMIDMFTPVRLIDMMSKSRTIPEFNEVWNNTLAVLGSVLKTLGIDMFGVASSSEFLIVFYFVAAGVVGYLLYTYKQRRVATHHELSPLFIWAVAVIILIAVVTSMTAQRYMIIVPFALAVYLVLKIRPSKDMLRILAGLVIAAAISFTLAIVPAIMQGLAKQQWREVNSELHELIGIAQQEGATKGYTSLKFAQPLAYMSEHEITGVPLTCNHDDKEVRAKTKPLRGYVHSLLLEKSTLEAPANRVFVYVDKKGACDGRMTVDMLIDQINSPEYEIRETSQGGAMIIYNEDIRQFLVRKPTKEQ